MVTWLPADAGTSIDAIAMYPCICLPRHMFLQDNHNDHNVVEPDDASVATPLHLAIAHGHEATNLIQYYPHAQPQTSAHAAVYLPQDLVPLAQQQQQDTPPPAQQHRQPLQSPQQGDEQRQVVLEENDQVISIDLDADGVGNESEHGEVTNNVGDDESDNHSSESQVDYHRGLVSAAPPLSADEMHTLFPPNSPDRRSEADSDAQRADNSGDEGFNDEDDARFFIASSKRCADGSSPKPTMTTPQGQAATSGSRTSFLTSRRAGAIPLKVQDAVVPLEEEDGKDLLAVFNDMLPTLVLELEADQEQAQQQQAQQQQHYPVDEGMYFDNNAQPQQLPQGEEQHPSPPAAVDIVERLRQLEQAFLDQLNADAADAATPPPAPPHPRCRRRQPVMDVDARRVARDAGALASNAVSRRLQRARNVFTSAQKARAARVARDATTSYLMELAAAAEENDEDDDYMP
ncbi:hypothetical protein CkaCkLH20_12624 [Colletotrichum karsti]|uniref:Uncharacterized protein n=1 Tax=Colletotrichum karsti TaxID=1095194 RepID=A0A9P6HUA4_9PEZI|nr:uncharacterized protein CkaCkLH20_12624 [Colletotrichum karsti]KAF9869917.1 hypothetical protein CkaCkLH20_12624 [Colletotrichum karsti]